MKHIFTTVTEARRYIEAVGRSRLYTSDGGPPLPRCNHPDWLTTRERSKIAPVRGRSAPCLCESRTLIDLSCPWVMLRHTEVVELDGAFIVEADPREASVMGERVVLGAVEVVLSRVPTVALTPDEREHARPTWPVRESDAEFAERTKVVGPRFRG